MKTYFTFSRQQNFWVWTVDQEDREIGSFDLGDTELGRPNLKLVKRLGEEDMYLLRMSADSFLQSLKDRPKYPVHRMEIRERAGGYGITPVGVYYDSETLAERAAELTEDMFESLMPEVAEAAAALVSRYGFSAGDLADEMRRQYPAEADVKRAHKAYVDAINNGEDHESALRKLKSALPGIFSGQG